MNFDLDCLRTFLTIADTMSFSRAADTVGRSQSTISQQIAKLELQVGRTLLMRRKGRVTGLTAAGDRLMPFARRILQLNDDAFATMSSEGVLVGHLRLGVPLDFFGRDFSRWLAGFKSKHPMVALEVESSQSDNLFRRRSEFDLAFFKQDKGSNVGTVALSEQLVWVCGSEFMPELESSLPLILFPEGCADRRCALAALESERRPWHISLVSPSFDNLRSALVEGIGLTVLARGLVTPPLRVIEGRSVLPRLPAVELVYAYSNRSNSLLAGELGTYLADRLSSSSARAAGVGQ